MAISISFSIARHRLARDHYPVVKIEHHGRMRLAVGTGVWKVGAGLILGRDRPQVQRADVGATCEGVAMILAEWRGLGWVAQSQGTVRIVDRPAPDAITQADIN